MISGKGLTKTVSFDTKRGSSKKQVRFLEKDIQKAEKGEQKNKHGEVSLLADKNNGCLTLLRNKFSACFPRHNDYARESRMSHPEDEKSLDDLWSDGIKCLFAKWNAAGEMDAFYSERNQKLYKGELKEEE